MNRTLGAALGLAAVLVLAAGGFTYAYFFSGLHSTPKKLALTSPAAASPSASATASGAGTLTGKWTVASGSQAGFRVDEVFVGQGGHQAVSRTPDVSGGATAGAAPGGSYEVTGLSVSAGLSGLKSQDQVAGRDVSQRDFIVQQQLGVRQFPNATFTAGSFSVPESVATQPATLSVPGTLTIHGVSKQVTVSAQAQMNGGRLEVAGSTPVTMTDYGVQPPRMGFVTVSPQLTVEFDLFLTQAAA